MYTNSFVTAPSFGVATVYGSNSSGSGCDTNYITFTNNTGCMITHDYSGQCNSTTSSWLVGGNWY